MEQRKLNTAKNSLSELKSIHDLPRLYLADYFTSMFDEVDMAFTQKKMPTVTMNTKWIEILKRIESFGKECMRRTTATTGNQFAQVSNETKQNIQQIEIQLNTLTTSPNKILKQIEAERLKMEKILFGNKTIIFMNDYGWPRKTFLVIVTDEYISKNNILGDAPVNEPMVLTGERLKAFCLKRKLSSTNLGNLNEFNLDMINLKELYLGENRIISIEDNLFQHLTKLKRLYLWHNKLGQIKANTFSGLVNLKQLLLSENKIGLIEENSFKDLTRLERLLLNGNQLTQIDQETFNGLENLKELWLQSNKISLIKEGSFKCLVNLKELRLSCNKISSIDAEIFQHVVKLERIWLDRNKIGWIERTAFVCLVNLKKINYSRNNKENFENLIFKNKNLIKQAW